MEMEFFFDDRIPTQFYTFLAFWSLTWIITKFISSSSSSSKKEHFSANEPLHSFCHVIGMTMATISLYFNNDNTFSEANTLLWFTAYFIVDLLDCLYRRDAIYTIHAIIALGLCFVNSISTFHDLRMASLGSFTELSSLFLRKWKKTKDRHDFQLFCFVFFLCRLVWVPVFVWRADKKVRVGGEQGLGLGHAAYFVTGAFYLLQLSFFYKMMTMLMNYKEKDATKKEKKNYKTTTYNNNKNNKNNNTKNKES